MEQFMNFAQGLGIIVLFIVFVVALAIAWDAFVTQLAFKRNAKIIALEKERAIMVQILRKVSITGVEFTTYESNVIDDCLGTQGWNA